MRTIALRFGEHFAPECGTIAAHQEVINAYGCVWYGKMGTPISKKMAVEIMECESPKILLIRSGKVERYWAFLEKIQYDIPNLEQVPLYYRNIAGTFKTWFKIKKIVLAPKDIMSKCFVTSSGNSLGEVSKHSMSPYFIIDYVEGGE